MCLNINIPEDAARTLQRAWGKDIDRRALEALLIEAYRRREVSVGYLGRLLGMGVVEADQWLAGKGVALEYDQDDLARDLEVLRTMDARDDASRGSA
jgi:predicted HTH domain antitoxin